MRWEIPEDEISLAFENEFDGLDRFVLVQEILETRKEVKQLRAELSDNKFLIEHGVESLIAKKNKQIDQLQAELKEKEK